MVDFRYQDVSPNGTLHFIMYNIRLVLIFLVVFSQTTTISGQGTAIPLSNADIQELVDAHNLFRGMVEPPASNMQPVEWNTELAGVAQAYAEMCIFRDNPDRADQAPSFPTVGENLSASNTRTPNYTEFVERGWFSQRVNYNYDTNMCSSPGSCTDYTQLVWADSTMIGCGVARCPTIIGLGLPDAVILVCNYGPEGNIPGQRPYATGEPCTQCPENLDFCIMNVCSITPPTTPSPIPPIPSPTPPPTPSPTPPPPSPTPQTLSPPTTTTAQPPDTTDCEEEETSRSGSSSTSSRSRQSSLTRSSTSRSRQSSRTGSSTSKKSTRKSSKAISKRRRTKSKSKKQKKTPATKRKHKSGGKRKSMKGRRTR